ncbi:MAG: GxxExxY protein [bacterium]
MIINEGLTAGVIGAAIDVHKYWGPGLYEEIYERSLCEELRRRGIAFESQLSVPLLYRDVRVGDDLRLDLLVEKQVVVEIKAISELLPVHESQIMTYMRLTRCRIGLLLNFNVFAMKQGIRRFVL